MNELSFGESDIETRLERLGESVKYLTQNLDRIGGMVQMMLADIERIKQRTHPEEIRKVAHS